MDRWLPRWPVLELPQVTAAALTALVVDGTVVRRRAARLDRELQAARAALVVQTSQAAALTQQLHVEARTDPLTGLGNRRRWSEQLALELERARRSGEGLAVAVVDLDRFKDVNDRHGHAAGDQLLRDVAGVFTASVRSIDVLARLGGEEFGIALPQAGLDDAVQIVERVRTGLPPGVTCSTGLAVWDGEESPAALQGRADAAMYRAKSAGRDRLVVD